MSCNLHGPVVSAFEGTIINQQTGREMQILTEFRTCGCVTWREA